MQHSKIIAVLLTATMLTACTEPNGAPGRGIENGGAISKANVGAAVGVVSGVAIGSAIGAGAGQVAAMVGGGLLGGILGNSIGASLDNADRVAYDRASTRALETGTTQSWKNPKTGNHGSIRPHKRYKNDEGNYCREYTQTIVVEGKKQSAQGTACRQDDGSWSIKE